jgi:hypothetical protein
LDFGLWSLVFGLEIPLLLGQRGVLPSPKT